VRVKTTRDYSVQPQVSAAKTKSQASSSDTGSSYDATTIGTTETGKPFSI